MRLGVAIVLLALAATAIAAPPASAGHTLTTCLYGVWYPQNPPGWTTVCLALDWVAHNPVSPLANCLVGELASLDIRGAVACA